MEFHEKIQELRRQRGLTQEELAEVLFVSRTAVSKWEQGRGYPSIESLKALAKFFGVTIDQLLSGEELLDVAEEESRQTEMRLRDLVFGLLDCSAVLLWFLPFFAQRPGGTVQAVSLLSLTEAAPYLKTAYLLLVSGTALMGILTLALQNCRMHIWTANKGKVSMLLNVLGVLLFMVCLQPYAAAFLFVFLMMKVLLLIKKP